MQARRSGELGAGWVKVQYAVIGTLIEHELVDVLCMVSVSYLHIMMYCVHQ